MLIELGELLAIGIAISFIAFLVWLALKKNKKDRLLNLTLENLKSMTPEDFEYTVTNKEGLGLSFFSFCLFI
jgi:hypothetical protein